MVPLVFPYLCSFLQLDASGQRQNSVYKEPDDRQDAGDSVEMLAQVQPDSMSKLAMWAAGRDLEQRVILYLHRRDLKRRKLLDEETGRPTAPRIGDRLDVIKNNRKKIIFEVVDPPGAYVEAVVPASFGPGGAPALFEVELKARKASR